MARTQCLRKTVVLLIVATLSLCAPTAQARPKARKQIAPWLVLQEEKGFDRIRQNADILNSLSVFGDPPREFIDRCHSLDIEVYWCVSGDARAFDTPSRAQSTLNKYLDACSTKGYDGIDLDFEHLDQALQGKYSTFLRLVSSGLHRISKKLSHCVGFYPGMELNPPRRIFYDPKVVAETCDVIRVMCYDMYWAPGRGDPKMADRLDTQGIGPTSSYPWAREAMRFWLQQAPREKLIMGLPAYSNDYDLSPKGKGKQVYASVPPDPAPTQMEKAWQWYERLPVSVYTDRSGARHIFYGSDAESTKAHLETVDELDLPGIGFWHFSSVEDATWKAVRTWLLKQ